MLHVEGAVAPQGAGKVPFSHSVDVALNDGRLMATAGDLRFRAEPFPMDDERTARGKSHPAHTRHCPKLGYAIAAAVSIIRVECNIGAHFGHRIIKELE